MRKEKKSIVGEETIKIIDELVENIRTIEYDKEVSEKDIQDNIEEIQEYFTFERGFLPEALYKYFEKFMDRYCEENAIIRNKDIIVTGTTSSGKSHLISETIEKMNDYYGHSYQQFIPIEQIKNAKIVCKGLKECIRQKGFLLGVFAEKVGISNKFLSEIIANKANPSAEVCLKICMLLGENFDRFFSLELPLHYMLEEELKK